MTAFVNGVTYQRVVTVTNWSYYNYLKEEAPLEGRSNPTKAPVLFPNPSNGEVTLSNLYLTDEQSKIWIFSRDGQFVKEEKVVSQDKSKLHLKLIDLSSGLYLVKIHNEKEIISLPLIIEK